jgi:hypothetical protein
MFRNGILDHILTCLGTHILIIGGKDDTGFVFQSIGHRLNVNRTGDITATPTYKNTNSLHLSFPPLFTVFSESADDSLLRKILVEQSGNIICSHVICALFANNGKAYCLYELRGFNTSGASVYTSKAGKTFIKRFGSEKRFDIAAFHHVNKLVGMIFHLVVSGASSGAFAAAHTFFRINSAHAKDLFLKILSIIHLYPPLHQELQPKAR